MKFIISILSLAISTTACADQLIARVGQSHSVKLTDTVSQLIPNDTCIITHIDSAGIKTDLDPVKLGEAELNAGHYNINPYLIFGGKGTVFNNITMSQCIAIVGQTASGYGITDAKVSLGNGEIAIMATTKSFNAYTDYRDEFEVMSGCDTSKYKCMISSGYGFHNVHGAM